MWLAAAVLREGLKPNHKLFIKESKSKLGYNDIVEQALLWALVAGRLQLQVLGSKS